MLAEFLPCLAAPNNVVDRNACRWKDPSDIGFVRRFLGTDAANSYDPQLVYTKEQVGCGRFRPAVPPLLIPARAAAVVTQGSVNHSSRSRIKITSPRSLGLARNCVPTLHKVMRYMGARLPIINSAADDHRAPTTSRFRKTCQRRHVMHTTRINHRGWLLRKRRAPASPLSRAARLRHSSATDHNTAFPPKVCFIGKCTPFTVPSPTLVFLFVTVVGDGVYRGQTPQQLLGGRSSGAVRWFRTSAQAHAGSRVRAPPTLEDRIEGQQQRVSTVPRREEKYTPGSILKVFSTKH